MINLVVGRACVGYGIWVFGDDEYCVYMVGGI